MSNLWADLGFDNPDEMEAKSACMRRIWRLLTRKQRSRRQLARRLGMKKTALDRLADGDGFDLPLTTLEQYVRLAERP